jgi:hypothetical protein
LAHHSGEGNNLSGNQMNEQNPQPTINAQQTTNTATKHDSNNILLDQAYLDFKFLGFTPTQDETQLLHIYDEPTTFEEAWDHVDKFQRENGEKQLTRN